MNSQRKPDVDIDERIASRLLDVLIRAGLILAMTALCFKFFAPFLTMMIWALILSVTLYPLHQFIAGKLGDRQGLAAALLVILGIVLLVVPTAVLVNSLGDSVQRLISDLQTNSLQIPAPPDSVADWPLVGGKVHEIWAQAHADLPALLQNMQPKIRDLARDALGFVAGIGGGLLEFLFAFVIAGVVMAFGRSGGRSSQQIFRRVAGRGHGGELTRLSVATIRAVAQGVMGVAMIQAIVVGLCLLLAGVPWPGLLAVVVLVFGIAQVPALVVTLPAIGYIWWSGDYETVRAIVYTVLLLVSGMADNLLKPLLLGRGVDAPMPVVLLGALGGMATAGILGMFVGATLFALGYQIFMGWVAEDSDAELPGQEADPPSAS